MKLFSKMEGGGAGVGGWLCDFTCAGEDEKERGILKERKRMREDVDGENG